jgi:hypothetical protein
MATLTGRTAAPRARQAATGFALRAQPFASRRARLLTYTTSWDVSLAEAPRPAGVAVVPRVEHVERTTDPRHGRFRRLSCASVSSKIRL